MSTQKEIEEVPLAIAGAGVVGGALIRTLRHREAELAREHRVRFRLTSILVRSVVRDRPAWMPRELLTDRPDRFMDAEARVVVEALGGTDTADRVVRGSLAQGRRVVTANKALIARAGPELEELAREHGGALDFEAAVGGAVPAVAVLRDRASAGAVHSLRGVLNGTCNFILTHLEREGGSLEDALGHARSLGYAEADATLDLDGTDAEDKLRILSWLAFGCLPDGVEVRRTGLPSDLPERIVRARGEGRVLRQVAAAGANGSEPRRYTVGLEELERDDPLARLTGPENAVEVRTHESGTLRLQGPGAGGAPTAAALLGDLLRPWPRRLEVASRAPLNGSAGGR